MNEPDLEEPIQNASTQVQDLYHSDQPDANAANATRRGSNLHSNQPYRSPAFTKPRGGDEDTAHEMPTRWWYASTGFPMIAGTFGPMANAFNICAVVENWRVEVPPGGTEEHGIDIPDPRWLIAVNGVSLAFALIANLSLLLNMAKRVPFRWAQPVTIFGFWISSVLLTVLVGIAAHDFHAPGVQTQALSQAYYYACWAAGLYQVISLMMCVTVFGALTHRYSSDFNLTMAQRSLMLQTIVFLTYLLVGALAYSHIEDWKYLDALYWADFTLLTVGLGGDMVPKTHLGRGILFPFSIGGIVSLGLVVSSIRTMVLDRGKRKIHARMTEKTRRKVVKQVETACEDNKLRHRRVTGLNKDLVRRLTLDPTNDKEDEFDRRRAEFQAMRAVEDLTTRRHEWMNLMVSTTAFSFLWFIGALVFWQSEGRNQGWTYFESLYFSWTSLLTIGYGDFVPLSNAGRPFFVFWSLLAIPSLTILISDMGDTVVKGIKDVTIWLGEVTILPSDDGSISERLRYGLSKALRIQNSNNQKNQDVDEEDGSGSDSSSSNSPFQQPGLVRLFKFPHHVFRSSGKTTNNNAISEGHNAVQDSENKEQSTGPKAISDQHKYHNVLVAELRKLYTDARAPAPKKYTFEEWAYYLKLLGEDESSSDFHRHAPVKPQKKHTTEYGANDAETEDKNESRKTSLQDDELAQWSWIGPRSPLISRGDKSEAEWLISRLFERLEESLHDFHTDKPPQDSEQTLSTSRDLKSGTDKDRDLSPTSDDDATLETSPEERQTALTKEND